MIHATDEIVKKIKCLLDVVIEYVPERPLYGIDRHRLDNIKQLARECKFGIKDLEDEADDSKS